MLPLPIAAAPDNGGDCGVAAVRAATQGCQIVHCLSAVRQAVATVVNLQPLGRVAATTAIAVTFEGHLSKRCPG